jgi:hypothetical protein
MREDLPPLPAITGVASVHTLCLVGAQGGSSGTFAFTVLFCGDFGTAAV